MMARMLFSSLFMVLISMTRADNNDTCTYTKSSLVVVDVMEPAKILNTTSLSEDFMDDCKQKCCEQSEEKCNKISYFKYKGKWRCVMMSCYPVDNCITEVWVGGVSYDIHRPETTTAAVTTQSTSDILGDALSTDMFNDTMYNETYDKVMKDFANVPGAEGVTTQSTASSEDDDDFWFHFQQELINATTPTKEDATIEVVTVSPGDEDAWDKVWGEILDEEEKEIEEIFGDVTTVNPAENTLRPGETNKDNKDNNRPNTVTDSNATSNYMNYINYDDTVVMILGGVATILFVVLLLVCVALRIHSKKERARYRPLKEDFDGSSNYHDEYNS